MRKNSARVQSMFVGDRFTNNSGCVAEVIKYMSSKKVTVKFLDDVGYELTTDSGSIRKAKFRNPYHPEVCGVGYFGRGEHNSRSKGKSTVVYQRWLGMIQRCYGNIPGRFETYRGCTVDPEWHNFQKFADWHSKQRFVEDAQIDKDILCKGNRVYSSKNCRLVPSQINKAMVGGKKVRESTLPTGVTQNGRKFVAQITTYSKHRVLGSFYTVEEAFSAYKGAKELYICELAKKYKDVLDPEIYESMMNWEVLITD